MRQVALLGSTGSIGTNTLKVMAQHRDKYKLVSLAAGKNIELLIQQIRDFSPQVVSVEDEANAGRLRDLFPELKVYPGEEGLLEVVNCPGVDTVISAITGTTALAATLNSIRKGHRICLANKETLVAAGELINRELALSQASLLPIDSEQSAIFQSIGTNHRDFIKKIILTASGGPFFNTPKDEFHRITVNEALAHPTWSMGTKITIDSATLMNKALEMIEAFYLFKLKKEQIQVIIHPQSIVHSMVEFVDTSVIAQLSSPDMKIPILYSLSYPDRVPFESETLDFSDLGKLEFYAVDTHKFPSIEMARYVLEQGKNSGAIMNAANEVAVEYFLDKKISFEQIFTVVGDILYKENLHPISSISDVDDTIEETKRKTEEYLKTGVTK